MKTLFSKLIFTGTQVNYFFVCKRKLWFFSKCISMEHTSDLVYWGSLLHQESYQRNLKELMIDNRIKIDFLRKNLEIHEIKKSRKLAKAHFYQLLYYLYYLKKKGIIARGIINYPLSKKIEKVELTPEREKEMENILKEIKKILQNPKPPLPIKRNFCKTCAYFNFCFC